MAGRVFGANPTPTASGGSGRVNWDAVAPPPAPGPAPVAQSHLNSYAGVFSNADPQTRLTLVEHLVANANNGDQRAFAQLKALGISDKDSATKVIGAPYQSAQSSTGNHLLDAISSVTYPFQKNYVEPALTGFIGAEQTAGEVRNRDGSLDTKASGHAASNADVALTGVKDRLLFGMPGQAELDTAGVGLGGRLFNAGIQGSVPFGAYNALDQFNSNNGKNFKQQLESAPGAFLKGAGAGAALGVTGELAATGIKNARLAATPLNDATKSSLLHQNLDNLQLHEAHAAATDMVSQVAPHNNAFQQQLKQTADNLGESPLHGPVKSPQRVAEKAVNDYGGDVSRVKDAVRGTITLNDPSNVQNHLDEIGKNFNVVGTKTLDGSTSFGYKDTKVNVQLPSGHQAEIILATPEMIAAKDGPGHVLYENARSLVKDGQVLDAAKYAQLEQQQRNLYGQADAAASKRLASSGVTSEPLNIASTGEYGRPEGSKLPTTALPSDSSLTTAPSTSKNFVNGSDIGKPPFNSSITENGANSNYPGRLAGETDKAYLKRVAQDLPSADNLPQNHSAYFNTEKADGNVPLDRLISTKSAAENVKGGANASKFMQAASDGVVPKRDPITVRPNGDGSFSVLDGNGTLTGAKELGWKDLPVQLEKSPDAAPKSVTLQSTAVPGLMEFGEQDVAPKVQQAIQTGRDIAGEVKATVAPASVSENAATTAQAVREYKATSANEAARQAEIGKKAFGYFNSRPDSANIADISHYERTGQFATAPKGFTVDEYSKLYQQTGDVAHQIKTEVFGQDKVGYIDWYVRRAGVFDFKNPQAEEKAASTLLSTYSSLKPSDGSLKHRSLDMPLDDAIKSLESRGMKLGKDFRLTTTNPEQLRQLTLTSAVQLKGWNDLSSGLKEQGLIKFGRTAPDGMIPLSDRAFTVMFPGEQGMVQAGKYYATPDVARILDNATSQGLEKSSIYQGLRTIKNNFNLVQLGLSAFHAGTTTLNASINDIVLGLRDVGTGVSQGSAGTAARGAGEVVRGVVPIASVIRDTYLGSSAFKDFASANPESAKVMQELINPSGFRLKAEYETKSKLTNNMVNAFANGNWLGGTLRIPGAAIEQSMRPIMEGLVPSVKLQSMLDRAQAIQRANPNISDGELKQLLGKASNSMDNIYGQMVYDNLMWNKTVKDLAQLSQRSVGWNLGTVREVGGGLTDVLTQTARGKGVTDRTLFAASLPLLIGTYGAAYQYLHTGQGPTELMDYFYPKSGGTDANGNPSRVSLPSYMKDVYAYGKNPIETIAHKQSPLFSMITDLFQNQNYYGDMIRNPDDPASKQLEQVGKYLLGNFTPFSLQGLQKTKQAGGGLLRQAETFAGITPAPASVTKSQFEQNISTLLGKQINSGPLTPEQQDVLTQKSQARQQIQTGQGSALADALIQNGTIKKGDAFKQGSQMSSIERNFRSLNTENQVKVLQQAKPADIQRLGNLDDIRRNAAYTARNKNANPTTQQAAAQVLQILGGDSNSLYQQKEDEIKAKAQATRSARK